MVGRDEAVLARDLVEPRADVALVELDDSMTACAEEVMMVALGAQAVARLAWPMRQRVDHAVFAEQRDGAVDGGETDALAPLAEARVDLLGGGVAGFVGEHDRHAAVAGASAGCPPPPAVARSRALEIE